MKGLFLLLIIVASCLTASSQSIFPPETNEYCPDTEYTFTVTLPKTYQSVIGGGGSYVT